MDGADVGRETPSARSKANTTMEVKQRRGCQDPLEDVGMKIKASMAENKARF